MEEGNKYKMAAHIKPGIGLLPGDGGIEALTSASRVLGHTSLRCRLPARGAGPRLPPARAALRRCLRLPLRGRGRGAQPERPRPGAGVHPGRAAAAPTCCPASLLRPGPGPRSPWRSPGRYEPGRAGGGGRAGPRGLVVGRWRGLVLGSARGPRRLEPGEAQLGCPTLPPRPPPRVLCHGGSWPALALLCLSPADFFDLKTSWQRKCGATGLPRTCVARWVSASWAVPQRNGLPCWDVIAGGNLVLWSCGWGRVLLAQLPCDLGCAGP